MWSITLAKDINHPLVNKKSILSLKLLKLLKVFSGFGKRR